MHCHIGNEHDGFPWDDIVKCIEDRKLCKEDEDEEDEDEEEEKPKEIGAHIRMGHVQRTGSLRKGHMCDIEVQPYQIRDRYWDTWKFTYGWTAQGPNWSVCSNTYNGYDISLPKEKLKACDRCKNDIIDQMRIYYAEKGTIITLYDSR